MLWDFLAVCALAVSLCGALVWIAISRTSIEVDPFERG